MKIAVATATNVQQPQLAEFLTEQIRQVLGDAPADLCFVFASAHFAETLPGLVQGLHEQLGPRTLLGMTGEAVIADDTEYEDQPALTLWAGNMPNVRLRSFHLSQEDLDRLDEPEALRDHLAIPLDEQPSFVLLGDPFSLQILRALEQMQRAYPDRPMIGGLASAADAPGENVMIFDGVTLNHGLCGVAMWGDVRMDTVVSQGCRPIGHHMVITRAEGQVIYQLGGKPPLARVTEVLKECSTRDLELARTRGLLVGRVINEYQPKFERGDFLIRNPLGFDSSTGAMAVSDLVRTGQTIQFHVRDAKTAAEDLDNMLADAATVAKQAAGTLLFSCNGRGSRLFSDRDHDARAVRSVSGPMPLAGLFCAGEIGPVGDQIFLHGHTASIGFLRPADDE